MLPKGGVRLAHHFGVINAQLRIAVDAGRKGHCHAVVVVGIDNGTLENGVTRTIPHSFRIIAYFYNYAIFIQFYSQSFKSVGFLDTKRLQPT